MVLRSAGADVIELERIRAAGAGRADIRLLEDPGHRTEDALMAESDVVRSRMRRSAGTALEPARAMAGPAGRRDCPLGRP